MVDAEEDKVENKKDVEKKYQEERKRKILKNTYDREREKEKERERERGKKG